MNQNNLQNKIEFLSSIKIRKGFQKYIHPTIEILQCDIETLDSSNAIKISKFINSSNSKCSISYWVLRKNIDLAEAKKYADKYSNEFFLSSYKNTNRKSVSTLHMTKYNGRGYSGYVNIQNHNCYCRSSNEFIMWHILSEKYGIENIKYEYCMFNINNEFNYKPDFFIYKNNILIKIIEVKDSGFIETENYKKIKTFLNEKCIDYEIVSDCKQICSEEIKLKLEDWKKSDTVKCGNKGILNPRFGAIVSQQTIDKIRNKAIERCKSIEYRKKLSAAQKKVYSDHPEYRLKAVARAIAREANISKEARAERIRKYKETVDKKRYIHNVRCVQCNMMIEKFLKDKNPLCKKCNRQNIKKDIGKKNTTTAIIKFFKKWINDTNLQHVIDILKKENLNFLLLKRKKEIKHINARVGILSITKYFGNVNELIKILEKI